MAVSSDSAHPMIEPLDYQLTPELAAERMGGQDLALYSLVWRAAVATLAEGPVLVETVIDLVAGTGAEPSATDVRLRIQGLDPLYPSGEDGSWGLLLPEEVVAQARLEGLTGQALPAALREAIDALGTGQLDAQGRRVHDDAACAPVKALLGTPSTWRAVIRPGSEVYGYDRLLHDMAAEQVGRPSTYASGIESALGSELLDCEVEDAHLVLTSAGEKLLQRVAASASQETGGKVDADFSRDLALALEAIERDPRLAGATLRRFSQRALGVEATALADWLDALEIEGESLDEALARAERSLPVADSWETVQLPEGLNPKAFGADSDALLQAREQLDHHLATPDRRTWQRLDGRQRAARRLRVLSQQGRLETWIAAASRDLLLRWWIDLSPQEPALKEAEVAGWPCIDLEQSPALQSLIIDLGSRLTLWPLTNKEVPA